ncbi:MAG: peptidoglycan recognition family protein [Actinomycetes bacterium]
MSGRPARRLSRRAVLLGGLAAGAAACGARVTPEAARDTAVPSPRSSPTPDPPGPASPEPGPEPTTRTAAVPLLCRDAWGAVPAAAGGRPHRVTGLMVHHTAAVLTDNRRAPARFASFQAGHQRRGWVDVAYHVGVDRNGHLYELRDPALAGDTATDYDPAGWFLVVADGNFEEQDPTDAQLDGIARALAWGAGRWGLDPAGIVGHRDRASTACPGRTLHAPVADGSFSAAVKGLLAAGGVELTPTCGAEGDALVAAIRAGDA